MPNWNDVLVEISGAQSPIDIVRQKYLKQLADFTGRNVICYYSGWLQKPGNAKANIDDDDRNGLMAAVHGMDRTKGLDLILHTPGGSIAATESIVHYLRQMFGSNIRAIVPQIAMSAGTMIACSAKSIVMGKQSNLGPIDPQFGGIPAWGVIKEFHRAIEEIKKDPASAPIWQQVVNKYHPTFLGECENAMTLANDMVTNWLISGMFSSQPKKEEKAEIVVEALNNHDDSLTHERHFHLEQLQELGLEIETLESDDTFQDLTLTVHHAFMHTFPNTLAIKIIENHHGQAVVQNVPPVNSNHR